MVSKNKKVTVINNLVAKHMRKFNKSYVERDKTKYQRKDKNNNKNINTDDGG